MEIRGAFRYPRFLRDGVHVADNVNDHRLVQSDGTLERGIQLAGFGHPHTNTAESLRDFGEIDIGEPPHLLGATALLTAISSIVELDFLIESRVVVDHDHGVDVVAARGLQFGDVIVEASIPGETHYR